MTSFRVAVDRDFQPRDGGERQTDFIDCVAWRSQAEFVSKFFQKGSMIIVSGRLQMREYTDRDGNRRTAAEIVAENIHFGESRRPREENSGFGGNNSYGGGNYGSGSSGYSAPQQSASAPQPSAFAELDDGDGELPF